MEKTSFKIDEKAKVSPVLSGLNDWVEGIIIKIFKNPFLGDEIAIKDEPEYFSVKRSTLQKIKYVRN